MGLPKSESGRDGILTVVGRATKMAHLIPMYQTITVVETARVYWDYVGKMHGIPRSFVRDNDLQFVSKIPAGILEIIRQQVEDVDSTPPTDRWVNRGSQSGGRDDLEMYTTCKSRATPMGEISVHDGIYNQQHSIIGNRVYAVFP